MTEVSVEEAQPRLRELLDRAATGDAVVIRNDSGARILLTLESQEADVLVHTPTATKRVFGQWKGKFELGPEFSEPLSDEELALFTESPVFPETDARGAEPGPNSEAN